MSDLVDRVGYLLANKYVDDLDLVKISSSISYNFQEPLRKPKIFVDISELVIRDLKTGVQRVVRSILLELCHNPPKDFDVVPVYCNLDKSGYFKANSFIDSFLDKTSGEVNDPMIEFYSGDIFLGLDLQHAGVIKQKDYLLWMKAHGVKIHFVVYDLLPITLPEFFWPEISRAHSDWFDVIRSFDGLVCISKAVADEVTKLIFNRSDLSKYRPEVNWFHLGADTKNSSPSFGLPNDSHEFLIKLKYIPNFLIVGTLEPRKCHSQVLAAFELLWARGIYINLVFIGKKGWHVDNLIKSIENNEQFKKRLYWLDGISDEYLDLIYDSCICLIAASRAEGFGLPLIKAAHRALPIIARDIPVFREVAGKNAFYFSGLKAKDIEKALISWMKLYKNKQHPKSNYISYLNWKQSVKDLVNLL
jgi:glycosyltransferase involved in cell wall biosynthesis